MQKGRSVTAAAFLLSIVVRGMDRAFGLSLALHLWAQPFGPNPALRPASVPQKTKASPSSSRRQARVPALPLELRASARELPSPSSVLLCLGCFLGGLLRRRLLHSLLGRSLLCRLLGGLLRRSLLGRFLRSLLGGLLGRLLLRRLLRRYNLLGLFGLLAFFLTRFRHRGPPVAAEQWSIGRLRPSPRDESSARQIQCRPRPARSPIEKLNRVYDRN